MALKQAKHFIGEQEYLQGERLAEIRHGHIDGEVFAMAGASRSNHPRLVGNVHTAPNQYSAANSFESFANELKVKVEHHDFYPDLTVVFNDPETVGLNIGVADIYRRVDNEDMRDYLQQLQEQAS